MAIHNNNRDLAHGIFRHGNSFECSCHLLLNRIGEHQEMHLCWPHAVNEAFATELYLKALTILEFNTRPPNTHNLLLLFDNLKQETKEEIRAAYDAIGAQWPNPNAQEEAMKLNMPKSLREAIERSKNAFVMFRYLYEGGFEDGDGCFLRRIYPALRIVILSRAPDFG